MDQDRQAALTPIRDREELVFLLSEASELEHALCCCYLFAAFSLKRNVDEGLDPIITALPATPNGDSPRAGPSFTFHRSIELLPHRDAAWPIFDERFEELEEFSGQLAAADTRKLGLDEVHASIRRLGEGIREPRGVKGRA